MLQFFNVTQRFARAYIADSRVVKLQIADENERSAILACPVGQVPRHAFSPYLYAGEKRYLPTDAGAATSKQPAIRIPSRRLFCGALTFMTIVFEERAGISYNLKFVY